MGLPEGWTKYGADGREISASQRYKALGKRHRPALRGVYHGGDRGGPALKLPGLLDKVSRGGRAGKE